MYLLSCAVLFNRTGGGCAAKTSMGLAGSAPAPWKAKPRVRRLIGSHPNHLHTLHKKETKEILWQ
ncbi:hypothetical protein M3221_02390 [Domibacillus indicus]|uniref:hypothetical protein n=1 Tax=Domibacillus indicus TaxID=1437523 RepID=UPI00204116A0|nr:hypothetical protein [Domibacillus indicus]MCM3787263.1 hypothetical protein [Domibacillus indicus]